MGSGRRSEHCCEVFGCENVLHERGDVDESVFGCAARRETSCEGFKSDFGFGRDGVERVRP